jgi:DNA/RNA-binding domain of Phe-tRNA-synthetase-like protein
MTNPLLVPTQRWREQHPGARAAVVAYAGLSASAEVPAQADLKRSLEKRLRERWGTASRQALLADPTLAAYQRYDQRFGQNYHVAMQIRSVAQQGKPIPSRNPLIEVMFMTELATGVLAAAQDADQIALPVTIDSAMGTEEYTRYDGVVELCKRGDQVMLDAGGTVLTSISQGPTSFGLVTPETSSVAYCFYFVPGVSESVIAESLAYLERCVATASPGATRIGSTHVAAD